MTAFYQASHIKRARSTKAEVERRRLVLRAIVEAMRPMTVRQVFYQATVAAVDRSPDQIGAWRTVDQWDADPWLLSTPDGVVELRTGRRRRNNPGDHMTKIAAVGPGGDCPRFLGFLDKITGGDAELTA